MIFRVILQQRRYGDLTSVVFVKDYVHLVEEFLGSFRALYVLIHIHIFFCISSVVLGLFNVAMYCIIHHLITIYEFNRSLVYSVYLMMYQYSIC